MTPTTAAYEHRKGVWSGEIPTPIDWFNGPMTKPKHLPWVPSPITRLYHDNANYMFGVEKPEIASSSIPRASGPYKEKLGKRWAFLEEDTPDYGGVAWKVGSDPSCLVVPGLIHESESYWMAIAMHVYNSSKYWMCVKAQHLEFLERVLSDSTHPRFEYYHILNAQFRQMPQEYVNILTPSATLKARKEKERAMVPANLWQTLCIPRQFVNHLMMQVTADLYSIYLVLFLHTDIEEDYEDYTPDFAARGNYDNRHCALRLNSNLIYEPLLPLVANPKSYRLPRITFEDNPAPGDNIGADGKQDDAYHPWLCDFLDFPAPEPLDPETVVAEVDDEHLEKVLWVTLFEEESQRQTRQSKGVHLRGGGGGGWNLGVEDEECEEPEETRIWTGTRFKEEGEPDSDEDIKILDNPIPTSKPKRIPRYHNPTPDGRTRQREVYVPLKLEVPKYEKMSADAILWPLFTPLDEL